MRFFHISLLVTSLFIGSAPAAFAESIPYNANVTVKVGKTAILKGVRGNCGAAAPSWAQISGRLPASTTGRYSDGGTGTVDSSSCGGSTPARAVKFTATKKGSESLTIFNDAVSITVE